MMKFKKDRIFLLKELQSIVTSELERSEDRRNSRKLKAMRKTLNEWISEMVEKKNEKI